MSKIRKLLVIAIVLFGLLPIPLQINAQEGLELYTCSSITFRPSFPLTMPIGSNGAPGDKNVHVTIIVGGESDPEISYVFAWTTEGGNWNYSSPLQFVQGDNTAGTNQREVEIDI